MLDAPLPSPQASASLPPNGVPAEVYIAQLQQARARADRLTALVGALAGARTAAQVAAALVENSHAVLQSAATLAYLRQPDGTLRLAAWRGINEGAEVQFATLPLSADMPLTAALREGTPLYFETREALATRFPDVATMRIPSGPVVSIVAHPLGQGDALVGGVAWCFTAPRAFDSEERTFLDTLLLQCLPALERARAYDAEVTARQQAQTLSAQLEAQQQSLSVLADVGTVFASELDFDVRLQQVARAVVPRLADWCAIDLTQGDEVRRVAVHHSDPAKVALAFELQRRYPPDPSARHGVHQVLRTGVTEYVREIPESLLQGAARDPEHLALVKRLGLRSYVVVPVRARGRILGALTLVYAESDRRFDRMEVALAEEVARRAGLALENALLYREARLARAELEAVFNNAPAPIAILRGPEHRFEFANPQYEALVGYRSVVGKTVREVFPDLASQPFFELLDGVYQSGESWEGHSVPVRLRFPREAPEQQRYLNIVYQASRNASGVIDGILVFAYDVTAQQEASELQARAADSLRRRNAQLALNADVGVAFTQSSELREMLQRVCEAMVKHLDAAFARVWKINADETTLELQASAGMYTHIDGGHARVPVGKFKIGLIAQEGLPHLTNDVQHDPRVGNPEWARQEGLVAFAGYPLKVEGRVIGVIAMFSRTPLKEDVLETIAAIADSVAVGIARKRAERLLREERETLDVLNRVGQTLAAQLDLDALVQAVTDSATRLCGAQFGAFFYNITDDRGERYTLYSISGVPREAFSRFPMPRNTQVFAPTFNGEGVLRSDDIRKDPRYGHNPPHHGMPDGHLPVVSYLAVPVISRSGEVIGGLFFGHERPGVFTERAEKLILGIAAQAAVAMDNARLYKDAQKLIGALERSNADLDQFAYVASHDLKAPLRGIANLSSWMEEDLGPALTGESRRQMQLLRGRVARMEALIDGILSYSRAGRTNTAAEVDTGRLLAELVELISPRPPARVVLEGEFPTLTTARVPLQQVLMNLINNALKHGGREDLTVTVRARDGAGRVEFSVHDDGQGISPDYHEKIWGIFQTLEARDKVEGTGIGLAIVKKIIEMRGGRVSVESSPGAGATFRFTWPKAEEQKR